MVLSYCNLGSAKAFETANNGRPFCFLKLESLIFETYHHEIVGSTDTSNHFCLNVENIEKAYKMVSELHLNMCDKSIQFMPFWISGD